MKKGLNEIKKNEFMKNFKDIMKNFNKISNKGEFN